MAEEERSVVLDRMIVGDYDGTNGEAFIANVKKVLEGNKDMLVSHGVAKVLLQEINNAKSESRRLKGQLEQAQADHNRLYAHFQAAVSKINRVAAAVRGDGSLDTVRNIIDE